MDPDVWKTIPEAVFIQCRNSHWDLPHWISHVLFLRGKMRLRGRDPRVQTRLNTLILYGPCSSRRLHCRYDLSVCLYLILCSVEDSQLYFGLDHGFAGCLISCVVTWSLCNPCANHFSFWSFTTLLFPV